MEKTIYQVDSFTEQVFKGNPAGVMLVKEDLTSELMQNIALEMNLSETAFVNISKAPFKIRYFTPTVEVPLCGHATLASAHILYEKRLIADDETIIFKAKAGELTINKTPLGIKMVFPKYEIKQADKIDDFKEIIGFSPIAFYTSENNWTIAIAEHEQEIENAKPRFSEMNERGMGHLMITSLSEKENIDFVVRCFAPIAGINEDPVTGSAQCGLVPVWNLRTGKNEFNAEQISERTGKLNVRLIGDKVEITGKAVTVFKAEMNL